MTGENAAPLDGWQVTGKCCGELHITVECRICQERVRPLDMPANIELGTE